MEYSMYVKNATIHLYKRGLDFVHKRLRKIVLKL